MITGYVYKNRKGIMVKESKLRIISTSLAQYKSRVTGLQEAARYNPDWPCCP
jgi:hypothetical protein